MGSRSASWLLRYAHHLPYFFGGHNIGPQAARFILLNPMAQIIQDARYVLIAPENQTVWQSFSTSLVGLIPVALSVVIFIGGLVFFESRSKLFAELV